MVVLYLLAQAAPKTPATENGVNLFLNGLTNFGNLTNTDAIPAAIDRLWRVTMITGNMYKLVCGVGLALAVFAVGFWCVKLYKTLEEGGLRPAINDLVLPLILVFLLANGGNNLRDMTIGARNMMNSVNRTITRTISAEVDLKTAIRTLAVTNAVRDLIEVGVSNCKLELDAPRMETCIQQNTITVEYIKAVFTKLRASNSASASIASQADFEKWEQDAIAARNKRVAAASVAAQMRLAHVPAQANGTVNSGTKAPAPATPQAPVPASVATPGNNINNDLDLRGVVDFASSRELRTTILSMRGAFIYVLEVTMLVTGLVGPIFVALSLFPSGTKFLLNWGASFLSLGFCKICYSLISGLSALAMVYVGPNDVDMLVASLVLGILAPVLSFGIASGSGIGILNTISYVGQSYGINTGMSSYHASTKNSQNSPNGAYE